MSKDKQLNRIIKQAKEKGWRVERAGNNHLKFFPPSGDMISISSTPSDYRGKKNGLSLLKKAGLDV